MRAFDYAAPQSVDEVIKHLNERGDRARILAGGTDILAQMREGRRDADLVLDIKRVPEVNELSCKPDQGLRLGAAVPCCRIYEDQEIARTYPGLIDAVSLVGGIQIQGRASVGGNLCNASPAADTIPPLIVYEGKAVIAGPAGTREVLVEDFCTGPGKTVLNRGEFLVRLELPAPEPHSAAAYLRFIPRNEMDIAVVGVAAQVTLSQDRSKCEGARIALAAVAPTPLLAGEAGSVLVNGTLNDDLIAKAAAQAQVAAKPISDMRADADYRKHLVGVLTRRVLRIAIDRARQQGNK